MTYDCGQEICVTCNLSYTCPYQVYVGHTCFALESSRFSEVISKVICSPSP
nr:MAG TPA: hypothetical protein [Caudoviricetes sp.]DAY11712.1 MAG TPA: hypothetical protein [Caudoviricetes sp.]